MRALVVALAMSAVAPPAPAPTARPLPTLVATYEHDLATPAGLVPLTWASIAYDRARSEAFVVADGIVRIFDPSGMEVYRFGDDGSLGYVTRVAVLDDGTMILLSMRDGRNVLLRCDYRGELIAQFAITGLPEGFTDFQPDLLVHRNGRLYFAERGAMRVVVTDDAGAYRQSYALRQLVLGAIPTDSEQRTATAMDGFNVDAQGNLLFTMSIMFAVGIVSPSGEVRLFGTRGSTPGKFNNVGGVDADESGNIYVSDRLRSVISVWSPELRHLGDFGYRGTDTSNLITPYEIAVGNGRVFVSQAAKRGVRVFRVQLIAPPEPPKPPPPPAPPPVAAPARRPPPVRPAAVAAADPDRDGDGIPDRLDKCPDEFGPPPDGCPKKKYTLVVVNSDKIELRQQVHFATGKFKILPDSFKLLDQVAQVLRDWPKMRISIEGHTDNIGGQATNMTLSQRRAEAVRDYLVVKGISPARLEAVGFGPTKPIASNKTLKGKARNRRTELRVLARE